MPTSATVIQSRRRVVSVGLNTRGGQGSEAEGQWGSGTRV
eukprot:CAMPEP_0114114412 /NCGR_PEP_ID=MMETSP0043_2-20121206/3420_1 /TAXON_ID=464988 /ORGANISM="Hemiselmis andersenii, Strain CCMP644" /LENGTH=39 /DNA_ID= /DNA_START= /DNA_END= /DNA_ORIENTATION=